MFSIAHIFIPTVAKLIVAQVCIKEIDLFCATHVFIHIFGKLIVAQVYY